MLRRLCKGCLITVAVAALVLLLAVANWRWCLEGIGSYLVLDQQPRSSDAIVAVSGEHSRRLWAMELYERGLAELLIFNVSDTTYYFGRAIDPVESIRRAAGERGIPESALVINPETGSTWEDAVATARTADSLGLESLIVVSSPFNMRRCSICYRHLIDESRVRLTFCSVPLELEKLSLDAWWTRERELQDVVNEYLKTVFYYFRYLR